MTNLFDIMKHYFKVNWMTISIGFGGIPSDDHPVSYSDIEDFATSRLLSSCSKLEESKIVSLLSLSDSDYNNGTISSIIDSLSETSLANDRIEKRKWRFVALKNLLDDISQDPLYIYLGLMEFWSGYNFPDDTPDIIKQIGNAPVSYTDEFAKTLIEQHKEWIDTELERIQTYDHEYCDCSKILSKPEN